MTTYPMQYGYRTGTLEQMMAELVAHGHPTFVQNLRIWLIDQGGRIGIGDAWRAKGTQPTIPGFAPEGKSFHQDQKFRSGFIGCCAVDLVVLRDGAQHRSPYWKEVIKSGSAASKKYGLHCNIAGEPWHMQPNNIFGHTSWLNNGRPDPNGVSPPPPDGNLIKVAPPPVLKLGVDDPSRVRWLQQILNERFGGTLAVDGGFGKSTHDATIVMQRALGKTADGIYGQQTAAALAAWLAVH